MNQITIIMIVFLLALSVYAENRPIRTEDFKLIHYPDMDENYQWEMFDLNRDSDEIKNLYSDSAYKKTRIKLKKELKSLIQKLEDPVVVK